MFMAMKPALRVVLSNHMAVGETVRVYNSAAAYAGGNAEVLVQLRGGGGGRGGTVFSTYSGRTFWGQRGGHGSLSANVRASSDSSIVIGDPGVNAADLTWDSNFATSAADGTPGGASTCLGSLASGGVAGNGGYMDDWAATGSDWLYNITNVSNPDGTNSGRQGGLFSANMQPGAPIGGGAWVTVRGF